MTRYQDTFTKLKTEGRSAFIPFWMIGDPNPEASLDHILTMAEHADILELGMPFSDPLADGPTIQASVNRSLEAGTTTAKCFEVIAQVREKFSEKPIGLLVYLNLILAYGIDDFFAECAKTGVDSVLIPELPIEEIELVQTVAQTHQIDLVFLVSTNTPSERVAPIMAHSGGFIYAVSTPSITGAKTDVSPDTLKMVKNLQQQTDIPICIGFGVSSPQQVEELSRAGADGVIIGSKLFEFRNDLSALSDFCQACRAATKR